LYIITPHATNATIKPMMIQVTTVEDMGKDSTQSRVAERNQVTRPRTAPIYGAKEPVGSSRPHRTAGPERVLRQFVALIGTARTRAQ
jgi:hypothetical protein